MPESPEQREARGLRELEAKNVAHYSIMLQAWIETRMARDKSLVTLSAGGVGVLVTLLTTVGVSRPWQIYLYLTSFAGFLITIGTALMIYQMNSELIENDFKGESSEHLKLKTFDRITISAFITGAVFAALIAITSALTQSNKKGTDAMSNNETMEPMKRSLDGLSNLKPQHPAEQPPAETQQPPQQQQTTAPPSESPGK